MATIEKRTAKDGEITYRVKIRIKGCKPVTASFTRLTDAKRWEQQEEAAIRQGRHFKNTEAKKRTVSEFIDRYLELVKRDNPARQKDLVHYMDWWKTHLGYLYLSDLTRGLIHEKTELLLNTPKQNGQSRTHATVNRYTAALRHALNIAVRDWEWLEINPMNGMKKFKEPKGRDRYLTEDERAKIMDQCLKSKCRHLYPFVMLALTTGARAGELQRIRWQDIDFGRNTITLHKTKNGDKRTLCMIPFIAELLRKHGQIRTIGTDLVFPAQHNPKQPFEYRTSWDHAMKQAGLKNFRFHDLRHTTASYLAMTGSTLAELSACLGHKTLNMIKRYAHISENSVATAINRMNERMLKL